MTSLTPSPAPSPAPSSTPSERRQEHERSFLSFEQREFLVRLAARRRTGSKIINWGAIHAELCDAFPSLGVLTPSQVRDFYHNLKRRHKDWMQRLEDEENAKKPTPTSVAAATTKPFVKPQAKKAETALTAAVAAAQGALAEDHDPFDVSSDSSEGEESDESVRGEPESAANNTTRRAADNNGEETETESDDDADADKEIERHLRALRRLHTAKTAKLRSKEKECKRLTNELRCLVCQNQTVADSNAGLAGDLRRQVREMITAGSSDADIKRFMTERYGDFVLYDPPLTGRTVLLWAAPGLLLLLTVGAALRVIIRRSKAPIDADPEEPA